jgi:hypothetical protein
MVNSSDWWFGDEARKCCVVEHAPRLPNARTEVPGIKTIWADLGYLRMFLTWLTEHRIGSFAEVTPADLDQYLRDVTDQPASSTSRKRKALPAVQRLHAYARSCRSLPTAAAAALGRSQRRRPCQSPGPRRAENRTPRIHPDVMQPLLSAALLVTEGHHCGDNLSSRTKDRRHAAARVAVALFCIAVGTLMIVDGPLTYMPASFAREDRTANEIRLHPAAKMIIAGLLVAAGVVLPGHGTAAVALVALGMLLYTLIQSPGYFLARHQPARAAMFAVLAVLTCASLFAAGSLF